MKLSRLLKIPLLGLVAFAPVLLWLGFGNDGFLRLYQARQDREAQREVILQLHRENKTLLDEINRLRNDPAYLETVARRELNLIKDNEIIYRFEDRADPE